MGTASVRLSPSATMSAVLHKNINREVWRYRLLIALCVLIAGVGALIGWQMVEARSPAAADLRGFGVGLNYRPESQQQLAELGTSWYLDWTFSDPDVPGYRRLYVVRPWADRALLASVAVTRRGVWWSIGNEPNDKNQDNQTPAQYALFFHDAVQIIRQADPSARILSAGIADADWQWAEQFRQEYRKLTGDFPFLDGWNIHNYILGDGQDQYDVGEFKRRITAFRNWMSQIGDGGKPLILSEFGVLYGAGCCQHPPESPERGVAYMVETVTWLARADLVQAWAWFMVNSGEQHFNGDLFDAGGHLTAFGQAYRRLVAWRSVGASKNLLESLP